MRQTIYHWRRLSRTLITIKTRTEKTSKTSNSRFNCISLLMVVQELKFFLSLYIRVGVAGLLALYTIIIYNVLRPFVLCRRPRFLLCPHPSKTIQWATIYVQDHRSPWSSSFVKYINICRVINHPTEFQKTYNQCQMH